MEERLQKIIARAGIASRREAENMILAGEVTVNGKLITELGSKADAENDHIKVRGKLIQVKNEYHYILLNKPKGYITAVNDPEDRPVVLDLVTTVKARIYPVGRLDFNTEGALLLTNDGDLTNRLLSPKSHCPKTYLVKVSGIPDPKKIDRLRRGVTINGTRYSSCEIEVLKAHRNSWLKVVLSEGKTHQIKNMFEHIGNPVAKLRRVAFSFLTVRDLPVGQWRNLTPAEVSRLKRGDFRNLLPIKMLKFLKELGVNISERDRAKTKVYRGELSKKETYSAKIRGGSPKGEQSKGKKLASSRKRPSHSQLQPGGR